MSTTIMGLASGRNEARVLVVCTPEREADAIELSSTNGTPGVIRHPIASNEWHDVPTSSKRNSGEKLSWAKPVVPGLQPGASYSMRVIDSRGEPLAADMATVTTSPPAGCRRMRLVTGSCFDINGPHRDVLGQAFAELLPELDDRPTYNLWLGDQVYVDAPWEKTSPSRKKRSTIFNRYLETWGVKGTSSLAEVMRTSSNWYLPDDHEFWNGYPNPSWLTLFWHTLVRSAQQVVRLVGRFPSHPAAQGSWGATAGEAYGIFASTLAFSRFSEQTTPDQLQMIENDQLVIVLADTRWHRTIRRRGPGAGFMRQRDLDKLVTLLGEEERMVCLALASPLIGHLPHRGVTYGKVEYGPEDYPGQYTALWKALDDRRRAGRPTLVLGGDAHKHSVRTAGTDGLLEIVSSPLSLLAALDEKSVVGWIRKRWEAMKGRARGAEESVRTGLAVDPPEDAYPVFSPDGTWTAAKGQRYLPPTEASGITVVDVSFDDAAPPRIDLYHASGAAGGSGVTITNRRHLAFVWSGGPGGRKEWSKLA